METNVSTVIVVTGASRGIGKAIALSLAAPDTALIINCSKSAGRLELVKEEIIKREHCVKPLSGTSAIIQQLMKCLTLP